MSKTKQQQRHAGGRHKGPAFSYEEIAEAVNALVGGPHAPKRHITLVKLAQAVHLSKPALVHWRAWHNLLGVDPPWPEHCACVHCAPRPVEGGVLRIGLHINGTLYFLNIDLAEQAAAIFPELHVP